MRYRLGVDVGGTFTDLLLFDNETGAFWRDKTPSTPHDSSEGILNGVNAITASLAWEVAERGIRVVATAPGGTEAPPRVVPRNPNAEQEQRADWYQTIVDQTIQSSFMKRYGTLDEQAGPILFLASDEARYITGTELVVDGGITATIPE